MQMHMPQDVQHKDTQQQQQRGAYGRMHMHLLQVTQPRLSPASLFDGCKQG
jgi:hypothetical protein